jgi:hypothetical protein
MVEPAAIARSGDEAPKTEQDVAERVPMRKDASEPAGNCGYCTSTSHHCKARSLLTFSSNGSSGRCATKYRHSRKSGSLILGRCGKLVVVTAVLLARGADEPEGTITVGSPGCRRPPMRAMASEVQRLATRGSPAGTLLLPWDSSAAQFSGSLFRACGGLWCFEW